MKPFKTFIATLSVGALTLILAACGTPVSADDVTSMVNSAPVAQPTVKANVSNTPAALPAGSGYGQQGNGRGAAQQAQGGQLPLGTNLPAAGTVDDQEIADLLQMREEEKLARDVYITLGEQWNLAVHTNISRSEQQHMDAIGFLLERYGIADPVGDNPVGVFTNSDLQALYDQLVAQGRQSMAESLKVGATIEDVDIYDLQKALANTDNADIQEVYRSLMAGSENHMRAFAGTLIQQTGETYTPQYIEQSTFDAIMAASNSHGHGGYGQGGYGQGSQGQGGYGHGKGGRGGQRGQSYNLAPNS